MFGASIPDTYDHLQCRALLKRADLEVETLVRSAREVKAIAWAEGKASASRERDEYARRWRLSAADADHWAVEYARLAVAWNRQHKTWHARLGRDLAAVWAWGRRHVQDAR